jgi:hypothetical protein
MQRRLSRLGEPSHSQLRRKPEVRELALERILAADLQSHHSEVHDHVVFLIFAEEPLVSDMFGTSACTLQSELLN